MPSAEAMRAVAASEAARVKARAEAMIANLSEAQFALLAAEARYFHVFNMFYAPFQQSADLRAGLQQELQRTQQAWIEEAVRQGHALNAVGMPAQTARSPGDAEVWAYLLSQLRGSTDSLTQRFLLEEETNEAAQAYARAQAPGGSLQF